MDLHIILGGILIIVILLCSLKKTDISEGFSSRKEKKMEAKRLASESFNNVSSGRRGDFGAGRADPAYRASIGATPLSYTPTNTDRSTRSQSNPRDRSRAQARIKEIPVVHEKTVVYDRPLDRYDDNSFGYRSGGWPYHSWWGSWPTWPTWNWWGSPWYQNINQPTTTCMDLASTKCQGVRDFTSCFNHYNSECLYGQWP